MGAEGETKSRQVRDVSEVGLHAHMSTSMRTRATGPRTVQGLPSFVQAVPEYCPPGAKADWTQYALFAPWTQA